MLSYEGTSLQALRKQAMYLGLFVQVARDSLGTNNALLELFIFSIPLPHRVTSGNLPQLGNTSTSLCTAWGNLSTLGKSPHHLQNPEKN